MNAIELRKIIRLHRLWLDGDTNGVRADLSDADLTNADLHDADLSNADLSNANLRGADLRYADLRNANLRWANLHNAKLHDADLSNANLHDANLRYADLRNADLTHADLRYVVGDGARIHTIQTGIYTVVICGQIVSIDCQSHNWSDWVEFNDTLIRNMGGQKAVDFWRIWKPILTAVMEVR